ncbi:MAG: CxxxxCH/CxxCH domain-containing protein [Polyangiaceae bacterium]
MPRARLSLSFLLPIVLVLIGCGGTDTSGSSTTSGGGSTTTTTSAGGTGGDSGGTGGDTGGVTGGTGGGGTGGVTGGTGGVTGGTGGVTGGTGGVTGGTGGVTGGTGGMTGGTGGMTGGTGGGLPGDICVWCHGDESNYAPSAPPKDLGGHTDTSFSGVGAHQSHLQASDWHLAVKCTECHEVPAFFGDPAAPTHANNVRDLVWGPLAQQGTFDDGETTCTGTYCHGGKGMLPDATGSVSNRTPMWTLVDGSQKACGQACHTTPPGAGHPVSTDCAKCHSAVIATFTPGPNPQATWNNPDLHINGVVDLEGAFECVTCHGDAGNVAPAAPPRDVAGETDTTFAAVGAHQKHLAPSDWHKTVDCSECHEVPSEIGDPNVPTHANGTRDLSWGPLAKQGSFDLATTTCSGTYCHGGNNKFPDTAGVTVNRTPDWTLVDGSQATCGDSCHTTPPGNGHTTSTDCQHCHGAVIASFAPGASPSAVWNDPTLHINGVIDVSPLTCVTCHGDANNVSPAAPPKDTAGHVSTTFAGVGAHQSHMLPSSWHAQVSCSECHKVPATPDDPSVPTHQNGAQDISWGAIAQQGTFDSGTLSCSGTYCHGGKDKFPDGGGVIANRTPVWTTVDGTQAACGKACHTTPPGSGHTTLSNCPECHSAVIASFTPGPNPTAVWVDASLHIDGQVEVVPMTCTSCHGDVNNAAPAAPPMDTTEHIDTTFPGVGAHQAHLAPSNWHGPVDCAQCHAVPASFGDPAVPTHMNGSDEIVWGSLAQQGSFDAGTNSCADTYCHGGLSKFPDPNGVTILREPVWTTVDDTQDACGKSCHATPPGGSHTVSTNCSLCHGMVISGFTGGSNPTATWADASLHINGEVNVAGLDCTSCHGDPARAANKAAPPFGTQGETLTTQPAVGAHQQHLTVNSTWHRDAQCMDCHTVPSSPSHTNGVVELNWGPGQLASADGATPSLDFGTSTCSGVYCHGNTLEGPKAGGVVNRTPVWTTVNGTFDACGTTCHTNPPGDGHPEFGDCSVCHAQVVAGYNQNTMATTWSDRTLHIDGVVENNKYHDLLGWTSPKTGPSHHGSRYFLENQQKDEHGRACTECHGANLDGGPGTVGVSCNSCHATWRDCTFCHGTPPNQVNPPLGVAGETAATTLAVGDHTAHLVGQGLPCTTCHAVPPANNIAHTLSYAPSASLSTAGHHGDVSFAGASGAAVTTVWNVNATSGNPVTARGTCTLGCHSNGKGGNPVTTPYWGGGTWTSGCNNCHGTASVTTGRPSTGEHANGTSKHSNLPCTACHPAASGASHMNGSTQLISPLSNAGKTMTWSKNGNCGVNNITCSGNCHGSECWY